MAEPIQRRGSWWQETPDGSWLRWNDQSEAWETRPMPPPPPDGNFSGAIPRPQSVSATVLPTASPSVLTNGEVPAEWWQRALAALIDGGILLGVFLIAALGGALVTSVAPDAGVLAALFVIAAYLFGPVYFIHHHGVHGQTVGKATIGIHVCDELRSTWFATKSSRRQTWEGR